METVAPRGYHLQCLWTLFEGAKFVSPDESQAATIDGRHYAEKSTREVVS